MPARVAGLAVAVATAGTLALSGCGQSHERSGALTVVASTDAWASVAQAVTGDHAKVSALVSGADTDPHSFEVTPAAAAQVQDATLVVYNGDGYDPFIDKLLKDGEPRVNAYQLLPADSADKNEHVFYSLRTAQQVANNVADDLAKADPGNADSYHANAKTFGQQLDSIASLQEDVATKYRGKAILATEPVASHLVSRCGLVDRTPHAFAEAAEQGQDPSPADVATALDLISTKQVAALLFNPQTAGSVTNRIKQAAESHGVPVVTVTETLRDASLNRGGRTLWQGLDLTVEPGEFIAVLGPNGSGKTSLLRLLLGQVPLTRGSMTVTSDLGYVPQHRLADNALILRAEDLVGLGIDGHRWGLASFNPARRARYRAAVDLALNQVDASHLATKAVSSLSGGELQRVRIAQALAGDPALLLCDEPLLNLDPASAQQICALIDKRRCDAQTAVLFVTHEINPIVPYVDRILYLVDGRFQIGTVDEVMTTETLSELYRAQIDVVKIRGQYVVVGEDRQITAECAEHAHE